MFRTKMYSCPNGCFLPPRTKQLIKLENGKYTFDYHDFIFCPNCGCLMPYSLSKVKSFLDVYNIHPYLQRTVKLLYKSEFEAAAREAFVTVESDLKKRSKLYNLHGKDLVAQALKFEYDKKTDCITKPPIISINDLRNESDRNEQEGIMFMLMGFFQGPRNLFQHNHIGSSVNIVLSVIIQASFFLNLLEGHSISKNGKWIKTTINYKDIYYNMPKLRDRIKLIHYLKHNSKNK